MEDKTDKIIPAVKIQLKVSLEALEILADGGRVGG